MSSITFNIQPYIDSIKSNQVYQLNLIHFNICFLLTASKRGQRLKNRKQTRFDSPGQVKSRLSFTLKFLA